MTDMTQPIGTIKPYPQTGQPFPTQNVFVDDPVALVDDPVALSGGLAVPATMMRTKTHNNAPRGAVRRLR